MEEDVIKKLADPMIANIGRMMMALDGMKASKEDKKTFLKMLERSIKDMISEI